MENAEAIKFFKKVETRLSRVLVRNKKKTPILEAIQSVMECFPFPETGEKTWDETSEEITSFLRGILPSPEDIFVEEYFKEPLFMIQILHDLAKIYGFADVPDKLLQKLIQSEFDHGNSILLTHIWFSFFMFPDTDFVEGVVNRYRFGPGCPNPIIRAKALGKYPQQKAEVEEDEATEVGSSSTDTTRRITRSQAGPYKREETNNEEEINPIPKRKVTYNETTEGIHVTVSQDTERKGKAFQDKVNSNYTSKVQEEGNTDIPFKRDDRSKKASSVYSQLKDSRFSGDISQSLELTIRDYNVCARQHGLSPTEKADLFINAFTEPARTYFYMNANDSMKFEEMVEMMMVEYDSDARREQVLTHLQNLNLKSHMKKEEITDEHEGLTSIVNIVHKLTPQCPPEFRSEAHKIRHLSIAVFDFSWSETPRSNVVPLKYTFNQFVTALHSQINLKREKASQESKKSNAKVINDILFGQYARNPKLMKNRQGGNSSSKKGDECFKCGHRPWKPGHKCRPGAIKQNISKRLHNGTSAVHIIGELVQSMENEPVEEDDDAEQSDDSNEDTAEANHFDSMVFTDEDNKEFEEAESAYYTHHLESAMSKMNFQSGTPDFQ